jgi:cyanophycin synthetase
VIFRFFGALVWLRRALSRLLGRRRSVHVSDRVDEYRSLWSAAASAIGADFRPLAAHIWEVRSGDHQTRMSNGRVQFDDPVVLDLAGDKAFCYGLARDLGIPTPEPRTIGRAELGKAMREIPLGRGPYVVKPARGTSSGEGVSVGITSRFDLVSAMALASLHSTRIVIERLVAAESVRLLFLDGVMIHAVRRSGVRVEGDGTSTIAGLVGRLEPHPVPIDGFVRETIVQQGRSLDDTLPAGTAMVVRWLPREISSSRELRTVYNEDVTHVVGPALVSELAPLVAAVGSRFAGIDLVTNDPTRSLVDSGGAFLEINTTPGLLHHCRPSASGAPCAVAVTVLRRLLELDARGTR